MSKKNKLFKTTAATAAPKSNMRIIDGVEVNIGTGYGRYLYTKARAEHPERFKDDDDSKLGMSTMSDPAKHEYQLNYAGTRLGAIVQAQKKIEAAEKVGDLSGTIPTPDHKVPSDSEFGEDEPKEGEENPEGEKAEKKEDEVKETVEIAKDEIEKLGELVVNIDDILSNINQQVEEITNPEVEENLDMAEQAQNGEMPEEPKIEASNKNKDEMVKSLVKQGVSERAAKAIFHSESRSKEEDSIIRKIRDNEAGEATYLNAGKALDAYYAKGEKVSARLKVKAADLPDNPVEAYLVTALWAEGGDESEFDEKTIHDFSPESRAMAERDVKKLLNNPIAKKVLKTGGETAAGMAMDLWLSRNGHGAGFFDKSYDGADELDDFAETFKHLDLVVGDDGLVHFWPEEGKTEARKVKADAEPTATESLTEEHTSAILDYIADNPEVSDADFHEFVEGLGVDIHEAETLIYRTLSEMMKDEKQEEAEGQNESHLEAEASRKRKKGDTVYMTADALENYGEEYAGKPLKITHVATKYMPPKEFFEKDRPQGYHPGYDTSAEGMALYDFAELNNSLYEYEIQDNKVEASKKKDNSTKVQIKGMQLKANKSIEVKTNLGDTGHDTDYIIAELNKVFEKIKEKNPEGFMDSFEEQFDNIAMNIAEEVGAHLKIDGETYIYDFTRKTARSERWAKVQAELKEIKAGNYGKPPFSGEPWGRDKTPYDQKEYSVGDIVEVIGEEGLGLVVKIDDTDQLTGFRYYIVYKSHSNKVESERANYITTPDNSDGSLDAEYEKLKNAAKENGFTIKAGKVEADTIKDYQPGQKVKVNLNGKDVDGTVEKSNPTDNTVEVKPVVPGAAPTTTPISTDPTQPKPLGTETVKVQMSPEQKQPIKKAMLNRVKERTVKVKADARKDIKKAVREYWDKKIPEDLNQLINLANWDLWHGPIKAGEEVDGFVYPGWSKALDQIRDQLDDLGGVQDMWYDNNSGELMENEPQPFESEDEEGNPIMEEPFWEEIWKVDSSDVKEDILGKLAEYL